MIKDINETETFTVLVLQVSISLQVYGVFGHQKRSFSKMVPKVEFFLKTLAYRFRVDRQKRMFLKNDDVIIESTLKGQAL